MASSQDGVFAHCLDSRIGKKINHQNMVTDAKSCFRCCNSATAAANLVTSLDNKRATQAQVPRLLSPAPNELNIRISFRHLAYVHKPRYLDCLVA